MHQLITRRVRLPSSAKRVARTCRNRWLMRVGYVCGTLSEPGGEGPALLTFLHSSASHHGHLLLHASTETRLPRYDFRAVFLPHATFENFPLSCLFLNFFPSSQQHVCAHANPATDKSDAGDEAARARAEGGRDPRSAGGTGAPPPTLGVWGLGRRRGGAQFISDQGAKARRRPLLICSSVSPLSTITIVKEEDRSTVCIS